MPTRLTMPFTLVPHPSSRHLVAASIDGCVSRSKSALCIVYRLSGELEHLRIPPRRKACFAEELWLHTCFELFFTVKGESGYHEFNFSPSGEWAHFAFANYRERICCAIGTIPSVAIDRSPSLLELSANIELDLLDRPLHLGISAVVESAEAVSEPLSYWALKHPASRPDFHHPDAFTLNLDEIRN